MKKLISLCMSVALTACVICTPLAAAEKGGIYPMFGSCCVGPRIGLEMNEGKEIQQIEWIAFVLNFIYGIGHIVSGIAQGSKNGVGGFFASCCLGPRVGEQLDQRKIRVMEWLLLVPIISIVPWIITGIDAYQGKTMTQIEQKEGLRK